MPSEREIDFGTAEPGVIYRAVTGMSDDEFAVLMDDPSIRSRIIEALVVHMARLFRGDRAGTLEAVIHIKLWDRPGGGYDHFELLIANQDCRVSATPEHQPKLTLKVRPGDLRSLVTGQTGPRRLALKGRLRVIGDLKLGAKLPDLFSFDT
jgi:putative sterol carrier protein